MSRRLTGFGFCFCATLLFAAYYLGAAILHSGQGYDDVVFQWFIRDTFAWLLPILGCIFLVTGIGYLVMAESRGDE
ncbi:hypothetical protein T458_05175 [Brevibacillus panacihumi W25]|uniref:Uncharacterized protein n=1 Tax=Brevibacillus panacihumi W25 TaxID=1408254 RepID=V6MEW0_9BACL|nr:hypothetical protein [Brevibacillus panacihumi]EST56792.1 hypothetical protein T458_05175 [Brevibacillus panacihumi W25]